MPLPDPATVAAQIVRPWRYCAILGCLHNNHETVQYEGLVQDITKALAADRQRTSEAARVGWVSHDTMMSQIAASTKAVWDVAIAVADNFVAYHSNGPETEINQAQQLTAKKIATELNALRDGKGT